MLPDGLLFLQRGDRGVRPENPVFFWGGGVQIPCESVLEYL